jgi:gliding motility-associated lipoprotein GldH
MKKLFFLLFSLAILTACTNSSVYNTAYQFKNNVWKQKTRPTFTVNIPDTTITYDFTLSIRTTTDYKYNNIWIYLTTKTPFKQVIREPYEIKTCFPNGEWIGYKTGSIVEHKLVFKRRKLPQIGKYTFIVEQGVIQTALDEVIDITFDVSKAEQ